MRPLVLNFTPKIGKLSLAKLALVRLGSGVGSHVPAQLKRHHERLLAVGTFVRFVPPVPAHVRLQRVLVLVRTVAQLAHVLLLLGLEVAFDPDHGLQGTVRARLGRDGFDGWLFLVGDVRLADGLERLHRSHGR